MLCRRSREQRLAPTASIVYSTRGTITSISTLLGLSVTLFYTGLLLDQGGLLDSAALAPKTGRTIGDSSMHSAETRPAIQPRRMRVRMCT